ncbi:MAG: phosphopantetheine-binding protein [Bacteroidota bacterium]
MEKASRPVIIEKVILIISQQLGVDKQIINIESNLIEDLGADDEDLEEIIIQVESEFDISLSGQEQNMATVGEIINHILLEQ